MLHRLQHDALATVDIVGSCGSLLLNMRYGMAPHREKQPRFSVRWAGGQRTAPTHSLHMPRLSDI